MNVTSQMSARELISSLVDDNSFVEVGAMITLRNTNFNLQENEIPADGVITGYGVVNGNPVYIYCQDSTAMSGTIGEMHAKKIAHIYDLALKVGAPVIGIIDSAGMRLQEATDALQGFGEIYQRKVFASGVIPQITAIYGNCGGGAAILSSLSDFTFMAKNSGNLYVNSPNALIGNSKEKLDTRKADFNGKHGNVEFIFDDFSQVIENIRELISILPSSNDDNPSFEETKDDLNRLIYGLEDNVRDITYIMNNISDNHSFIEVRKGYAKEMVTGFIKLNGITIGAIGNRLEVIEEVGVVETFDGSLTTAGCYKAERFVKFCNAFNIPILTLTNVTGYKATIEEEKNIALAAAKLTHAFINANVPKVNVIVDKAYGSAYVTMNSKHIGADMVFAFENTRIGMMESHLAAKIMYEDSPELIEDKAREYEELTQSAMSAAKRGYVDAIIDSKSIRKHLIYAYEMLYTKRDSRPNKKHGTI